MIAVARNSAFPRQVVEQGQVLLVSFDPNHLIAVAGHYSALPRKEGIAEQNPVHSILPAAEMVDPNQLAVVVGPKDWLVVAPRHCWLAYPPDSMGPAGLALHLRPPSLLPH